MTRALALLLLLSTTLACGGNGDGPGATGFVDSGPDGIRDSGTDPVALADITVPAAHLIAEPSTLNFGSIFAGCNPESDRKSVQVANQGDLPTGFLSVSLNAGSHVLLESNGCGARRLAPGEACQLMVRAVGSDGDLNGSLVVTDETGLHVTVSLTGRAIQYESGFVVAPTPFDFGTVREGEDSAEATFTVHAQGCMPIDKTMVRIAGVNPDSFFMTRDGCSGRVMVPPETCELAVVFRPNKAGTVRATIGVTGTAGRAEASLLGTGIPRGLATPSPTVDFGTALTHCATEETRRTIPFVNNGPDEAGPLTVSLTNGMFHVGDDACTGKTLALDQQCEVTVVFRPRFQRQEAAELTVGAPNTKVNVALGGRGADPHISVVLNPTPHNFDGVVVGQQGPPVEFSLNNLGGGPVVEPRIEITGPDAHQFAIVNDPCSQKRLAPGLTCLFTVSYRPTQAGYHQATVTVWDLPTCADLRLTAASISGMATAVP